MSDDLNKNLLKLIGALGILALIPVSFLLYGFVTATVWNWFVVPTFGLPAIGIPVAIGIDMLLTSILPIEGNTPEKGKELSNALTKLILRPLVILSIAWIAKHFI